MTRGIRGTYVFISDQKLMAEVMRLIPVLDRFTSDRRS
jgi:DUF2075 family protein